MIVNFFPVLCRSTITYIKEKRWFTERSSEGPPGLCPSVYPNNPKAKKQKQRNTYFFLTLLSSVWSGITNALFTCGPQPACLPSFLFLLPGTVETVCGITCPISSFLSLWFHANLSTRCNQLHSCLGETWYHLKEMEAGTLLRSPRDRYMTVELIGAQACKCVTELLWCLWDIYHDRELNGLDQSLYLVS